MTGNTLFLILLTAEALAFGTAVFLALEALTGAVAYVPFMNGDGALTRDWPHIRKTLICLAAATALYIVLWQAGKHLPGSDGFYRWILGSLKLYKAVTAGTVAAAYAGMIATYLLYKGNFIREGFRILATLYKETVAEYSRKAGKDTAEGEETEIEQ
jgi:hypothetical protein